MFPLIPRLLRSLHEAIEALIRPFPPASGLLPAHAFFFPLNEPLRGGVSLIGTAVPGMGSGRPLWADRKAPELQVALLARSVSDTGSSDSDEPPRKPAPRMAPLSNKRRDDASRMQSIEQREQDAETVRRILDGDSDAYRILVQKYQQKVYGVVYGMVQNPEDAREISQDALIKAFKSLDRFRFDASFYTWLYRITVNMTIDHRRKMAKRRTDQFDETRMQKDEAGGAAYHHVEASPVKRLERKRLADKIQSAIDQLPTDQRTAIMLREVEGLAYKEIAEAMDCAEGTVMSRLFYGRKKLQEILKDVR
ncbi:MAG: sigma-70 family RNA polymerase sigma factor [Myxococcota bacterium]|nr:sigma-70 family RNA polymerase sigma factor [Myxococcota bacterium]